MENKTVVLIRGLGRHSLHWGSFPDQLKLALPDWGIELWDLPGFGSRHLESSPNTIEGIAADIVKKYGKANQCYLIVGYSLGGMVALEIAKKKSLSLMGLVIVNSSSAGHSKIFERLRPTALLTMAMAVFGPGPEKSEATILGVVSNKPEQQKKFIDDWVELRKKYPFSFGSLYRQLHAASSYAFSDKLLQTKTLVIASTKDRLVNVNCSRVLSTCLASSIIEHPSSGHDLVVDDRDWLVDVLKNFSEKCESS